MSRVVYHLAPAVIHCSPRRGASFPIAYRLYLPQDWAADPARRKKAGVPEEMTFQTKPEIALDQIRAALEAGCPRGPHGCRLRRRTSLRPASRARDCLCRRRPAAHLRVDARNPPPPIKPWSGRGRPPSRMRRDRDHQPQSVKGLALSLPAEAWAEITWREGAPTCSPRALRVCVCEPPSGLRSKRPRDEEWLLVEWPPEEEEPTKYWLATLPEDIAFDRLVALAKLRWRIERDYQELKQELGLGHYEGRGWRGFHHHATLCIAAYAFLVAERARIPPSEPKHSARLQFPPVSTPRRPRSDRSVTSELNRDRAPKANRGLVPKPQAMSMLLRRTTHRSRRDAVRLGACPSKALDGAVAG